ncbi:MAG: 1-acyl-sn-glycerol-3-phosphate acyltransferase, partial [Myxococcales bacterium]|nr:1-acyl-sn-glycerol-3-phosphate acyltransferase [Myxococcales bacterium]
FYFPVSLCVGSFSRPASQWAMRRWCKTSCDWLGIQNTLIDGHKLKATPQAVIVANHLSALDILVIGAHLRRDYRWLAKAELFKVPLSGWHLNLAGHIPVFRGERDRNSGIGARIHKVVEEGASVLFFPEGTRSRTGALKPFFRGAFRTAVDEGLPVLPLLVRGTYDLLIPDEWELVPKADRQCSVQVLDPILPEHTGDTAADVDALRFKVWSTYMGHLHPDAALDPAQADGEALKAAGQAGVGT